MLRCMKSHLVSKQSPSEVLYCRSGPGDLCINPRKVYKEAICSSFCVRDYVSIRHRSQSFSSFTVIISQHRSTYNVLLSFYATLQLIESDKQHSHHEKLKVPFCLNAFNHSIPFQERFWMSHFSYTPYFLFVLTNDNNTVFLKHIFVDRENNLVNFVMLDEINLTCVLLYWILHYVLTFNWEAR